MHSLYSIYQRAQGMPAKPFWLHMRSWHAALPVPAQLFSFHVFGLGFITSMVGVVKVCACVFNCLLVSCLVAAHVRTGDQHSLSWPVLSHLLSYSRALRSDRKLTVCVSL